MRYHTGYHAFSRSLAWLEGYLQRVTARYRKIYKKMHIYIFFKKMTVRRGNPLQIAPKLC